MDHAQLIIIAAIIIFFVLKKLGQVNPRKARELKAAGAIVIDVRSTDEFAGGHIAGAINVPLDQLSDKIESVVPDRQQSILIYCLSGTRSALARRILLSKNYSDIHNLGSIYRARSILGGQ